jgi:hypothetical protein
LRKDQWANRSDEYKLKWSEDKQKWWDDQSDEYKLKWSEDKQKWWDDQSDEYKLEWSKDQKIRWDNQSDEYKLKWSEETKQRHHDKRKLSSGSTEETIYYAIDGADADGKYILITETFGTNDLNFRKWVKRRNGKKYHLQFHTMETINELHLQKCATKTCINKKNKTRAKCTTCLGYRKIN